MGCILMTSDVQSLRSGLGVWFFAAPTGNVFKGRRS